MIETEQSKNEWLLNMCFVGKVRDLSKHMGVILFDNKASKIVSTAQKISEYVSVSNVVNKLSGEYFYKYFQYKNISNPLIKNYLIEKLIEFENYTGAERKYDSMIYTKWCLKYKDKWCGPWEWKEATGVDCFNNFQYEYADTIAYFYGYEKGIALLNHYGIGSFGGGSCADYIQTGVLKLKPHILEAVEYLKTL